jgi:hypothetical protein
MWLRTLTCIFLNTSYTIQIGISCLNILYCSVLLKFILCQIMSHHNNMLYYII